MSDIITVPGPSVTTTSRPDAISQLYSHPRFPKNARLADIYEDQGKWVAKIKLADFPFSDDGKGGGDDEESTPKPPKKNKDDFEGPNGDNADEPVDEGNSGSGSDSGDSSDDSSDKGSGKGGEKGELTELNHKLDTLLTALGISVPGGDADSPVPGPDGLDSPDAGPVPPPPPGAGAPSPHGGKGGPAFPTRGLKPGEAPPGSTPVGAPAFASTQPQNPFPEHIGKSKTFEVSDETNKPLGECVREIKALVEPWGYYVHQAKSEIEQKTGTRRVAALVADHPPQSNK